MKNILLLLSFVLFASSCRIIKMGNPAPAHPQPFVQLKSGQKIEATTVSDDRNSIVADKKAFPRKQVTFYSDGDFTYCRSPKKGFAKMVYTGDINVYRLVYQSTTYSNGAMSTSTQSVDYLQKNGVNEAKLISFKYLKKYIGADDPGYSSMKTFRKNRTISYACYGGGLGLLYAGAAIAVKNTNTSGPIALTAIGASLLSFSAAVTIDQLNSRVLKRAVGKHNGVIEK